MPGGLKVEIGEAIKSAMRAGNRLALDALRLVLSALKNEEIKLRRELRDEEIQRLIASLCKQRAESISLFRKGGRDDLAQKEEDELQVLRRFLPQPLTEDEVRSVIRDAILESGAHGPQDLGRVMKQVMPRLGGRSDGKRVNELAREILDNP